MRSIVPTATLLLTCWSCSSSKSDSAPTPLIVDENPSETLLVGVKAEDFTCESLFPLSTATELFGGRVERIESPHTPPAGVPASCNYVSYETGRDPIRWSYDLDCREGALDDGSKLMASYATEPDAMAVLVGQSGLDHHQSSLLFIDDDTPCYGRVFGPDQQIRKVVATRLAKALDPHSAPTGAVFLPQ